MNPKKIMCPQKKAYKQTGKQKSTKTKWTYRRSIQAASPQRHTQSRTRPPQTQTQTPRIGATSLPLQIGEQGR